MNERPGASEALTVPDEAAWAEQRAPLLIYGRVAGGPEACTAIVRGGCACRH